MKIKKLFCILFAAALLLAGCSSPAPQAVTEPETVTEPDPADPQEQIRLLANSVDIWRVPNDLEYEPYYYTVTDLDHNGRLEIIGASTQGTGIFTYGVVYEVGADFSSVQECMTLIRPRTPASPPAGLFLRPGVHDPLQGVLGSAGADHEFRPGCL